jgi:hypothetical protein
MLATPRTTAGILDERRHVDVGLEQIGEALGCRRQSAAPTAPPLGPRGTLGWRRDLRDAEPSLRAAEWELDRLRRESQQLATFSERLERWRLKAEAYEAKLTARGAKARPRRPYKRRAE